MRASEGLLLCQHNRGHPDSLCCCHCRNNLNGHHDRFILACQKGRPRRRAAPSASFASKSEQRPLWHADAGTRQILPTAICPLACICLHTAFCYFPPFISTSLYSYDMESDWGYYYHHIGKYSYRHIQNLKVSKTLSEHLTGLFLSSRGSTLIIHTSFGSTKKAVGNHSARKRQQHQPNHF